MTHSAGPAVPEPDDRALLDAHLAGDPTAFGELFGRHRDRLWAVALRTVGNPEDAADALQDALISAFRRADGFRGDAAVTTWLHRIVVNACLDRLRRAKVRAADPLPDDLAERSQGELVAAATPEDQPEAHALVQDQRHRVLAALEQLAPDQRAALVLVDMEGYAVAEAAAVLEVPTGTVKSRCARGRARLAELLSDLRPQKIPQKISQSAPEGTRLRPAASHPGDPPPGRPVVRPGAPSRATPHPTGGEHP